MTDNLRDRITAAVYDTVAWRSVDVPVAEEVADAVIAELGLEREDWNIEMGVSTLPRHMWVKPTPVYRYVTEWENDE